MAVGATTIGVTFAQNEAGGPQCKVSGLLPDHKCTPGLVMTTARSKVCQSGYSATVRNVTSSTKRRVFEEYGYKPGAPGTYEVDHLVPLSLGGSNDIRNLWPQVAPGWKVKDVIEVRIRRLVCDGQIGIPEAQHRMATDWRTAVPDATPTP